MACMYARTHTEEATIRKSKFISAKVKFYKHFTFLGTFDGSSIGRLVLCLVGFSFLLDKPFLYFQIPPFCNFEPFPPNNLNSPILSYRTSLIHASNSALLYIVYVFYFYSRLPIYSSTRLRNNNG